MEVIYRPAMSVNDSKNITEATRLRKIEINRRFPRLRNRSALFGSTHHAVHQQDDCFSSLPASTIATDQLMQAESVLSSENEVNSSRHFADNCITNSRRRRACVLPKKSCLRTCKYNDSLLYIGIQRKVSAGDVLEIMFTTIQLFLFESTVGDHPATKMGIPLTLQWKPYAIENRYVDEFESLRHGKRKTSISYGRYNVEKLVLSPDSRWQLLQQRGYTNHDLQRACAEADAHRKLVSNVAFHGYEKRCGQQKHCS
jgi:hypothetical protein